MSDLERYLTPFVRADLEEKIVLLSGPRQVGKTTLALKPPAYIPRMW